MSFTKRFNNPLAKPKKLLTNTQPFWKKKREKLTK